MNKHIGLVVPTIREEQIGEFVIAWKDQILEAGVNVYIVEDNAERTFNLERQTSEYESVTIEHMCHRDAPDGMLEAINVKSPSCRQIGMWKAYDDGCDVIVTLDDDVRPAEGSNLFREFHEILVKGVPLWVDPLLNYRSRGYPKENVGTVSVSFHVGSFLCIPDVDGETQLKHQEEFVNNPPEYIPRATIVPKGQLLPVNGGICGWRREITPFVHYTMWNEALGYRRFDDIWMGVIVKRLFDHCDLRMSYGQTFVNHIRASSAEKNVQYEKNGKKWNERFWEIFDGHIGKFLSDVPKCPLRTYEALANCLLEIENAWAQNEGSCMLKWLEFFKPIPTG